jgi:succinyl-CoA synthetase beta subunit
VRLEGTNAPLARQMLAQSGLAITPAGDLTDAALKAVSMAGARS